MFNKIKPPVAILGFGVEGQAALGFLQKQGVTDITICEQKNDVNLPDNVKFQQGAGAFDDLTTFATIIRSPGVCFTLPAIKAAIMRGATVTSLTKLTFELFAKRITAITGSNGKTTTTALVDRILQAHYGDNLIIGGNDRQPVLQAVIDRPNDPILMEISSFQSMDVKTSPHIAAILNITPNHLDWHTDMAEYMRAKENMFLYQSAKDWAMLNAKDKVTTKLKSSTLGKRFWIGAKRDDNWAVWENDELLISFEDKIENLLNRNELKVKTHPDNLLFAAAIAKLHQVPNQIIIDQIKSFEGVPHRLEYVRTINDVHFYNDSSCTTPESAMVVLNQFPSDQLIVMLGGSSKKADFTALAKQIVAQKTRVYLYGQEGKNIQKAIQEASGSDLILQYNTGSDFQKILEDVFSHAKPDDNIVLSPSCASFDMFENAKQRGQDFKKIVNNL